MRGRGRDSPAVEGKTKQEGTDARGELSHEARTLCCRTATGVRGGRTAEPTVVQADGDDVEDVLDDEESAKERRRRPFGAF